MGSHRRTPISVCVVCVPGSPEDVDKAVAAAKAAFATWGMTTGAERAVHLRAIAKAVRDNKDQLSR